MYEQLSLNDFAGNDGAHPSEHLLDIRQTADKLSVSAATVRNWARLGKIKAADSGSNKLMFRESEVERLLSDIITGKSDKLTKRRNKRAVRGLNLYADYIADSGSNLLIGAELVKNGASFFDENTIRLVLADLALKLYFQKNGEQEIPLPEYLEDNRDGAFASLLSELLDGYSADHIENLAFNIPMPSFVPYQDFLGYIYISVNKIAKRKSVGSYFTPIKIVDRLVGMVQKDDLFRSGSIIDPCCGTGNFLLTALKKGARFDQLYGNDVDSISVAITKLNLFLNGIDDIDSINSHIRKTDFLLTSDNRKFDIVMGNPPWGYAYTENEIEVLLRFYRTAAKRGTESFDLFLEQSLRKVNNNGIIAFVLPEALLNVKSHSAIRGFIKQNSSIKFVSYIGNAFTDVACPCILLEVKKDGLGSAKGCIVETNQGSFQINSSRDLDEDYWNFNLSDEEAECLRKIGEVKNSFRLKGQAEFALGIVTGSNKEYISDTKSAENELVLRGSDIYKYSFENSGHYIRFMPDSFQQVAPENLYRAPEKLLYRFICATPVFAYDNHQTLSLNSANILIPHVKGINIKYILAVLNSGTISFWCRKKYNSIKLLRSHIEGIPFPVPGKEQQAEVIQLADAIIGLPVSHKAERKKIFDSLENIVMDLYQLSSREREIILDDSKQYDTFL